MNIEEAKIILKFHRPDRPRNTERRQLQKAIDVILEDQDLISRNALTQLAYTAVILEPNENGEWCVKDERTVVDLESIDNAAAVMGGDVHV